MADNFNLNPTQPESLEAGGLDVNNPSMTYVDFANQISKNDLLQQQQAAMVKEAQARAGSAGLTLKQQQSAADMGVNPELKDFFTVPEATAYLKAAGIDDTQIKAFTDSIGDQQVVSRSAIDTVIRRKQLGKKTGQPFIATAEDAKNPDMTDENGDPLVAGQSYQAYLDQAGKTTIYVRSGGETLLGSAQRLDLKEGEADEKQWQKLGGEVSKLTESRRGNILMNTVVRTKQALGLLQKFGDNPPPQILGALYNDIASIMTGGVGSVEAVELAQYKNVLVDLNNKLGYYTGKYNLMSAGWEKLWGGIPPLQGIIDNIRTTLGDLLNTAADTIKSQLEAKKSGYRTLIENDPNRFQQMVDDNMKVLSSGLPTDITPPATLPAGATPSAAPAAAPAGTPAAAAPQAGPNIDALASALGLKKKAQ